MPLLHVSFSKSVSSDCGNARNVCRFTLSSEQVLTNCKGKQRERKSMYHAMNGLIQGLDATSES